MFRQRRMGATSWGWRIERLESNLDRLAFGMEKIRGDYDLLWRWANEKAGPVIGYFRPVYPSSHPEAPVPILLLQARLDALEAAVGELSHELQRVCAALEAELDSRKPAELP